MSHLRRSRSWSLSQGVEIEKSELEAWLTDSTALLKVWLSPLLEVLKPYSQSYIYMIPTNLTIYGGLLAGHFCRLLIDSGHGQWLSWLIWENVKETSLCLQIQTIHFPCIGLWMGPLSGTWVCSQAAGVVGRKTPMDLQIGEASYTCRKGGHLCSGQNWFFTFHLEGHFEITESLA